MQKMNHPWVCTVLGTIRARTLGTDYFFLVQTEPSLHTHTQTHTHTHTLGEGDQRTKPRKRTVSEGENTRARH